MKNFRNIILTVTTPIIFSFLTACGGGSGSSVPAVDTTRPTVTTTPTSNGNVRIGKPPLIANFSEAVLNSAQGRPGGANMVLTEKGSTIALGGNVKYDPRNKSLTFFPTNNLVANTEYQITLSDLFDRANNPLEANDGANYVWTFNVNDYLIKGIADIKNGAVSNPLFATNAKQQVLAVWQQTLGNTNTIYASINTDGVWNTPTLLESIQSTARFDLILNDVTSNGLGFAVAWQRKDGGFFNIYASVYNVNGWQNSGMPINDSAIMINATSAKLSSTYHPVTSATPAAFGEGYAIAWIQNKPHASIYSQDNWSTATAIGTQNVTGQLRIASNGRGYALVWSAEDPNVNCDRGEQAHADIYSSAKGYWINTKNNFPTIISAGVKTVTRDTTQFAYQTNVISNGNSYLFTWYGGSQIAGSYIHATVFTQIDSLTEQLYFDGPYKISNNGNVTDPQAISNGSGYAVAWSANSVITDEVIPIDPDNLYLFVNQYNYASKDSLTGKWSEPLVINKPGSASNNHTIASNGNNYALAWQQTEIDLTDSLYGRVFRDNVWTDSELLNSKNLGNVTKKPGITFKNGQYSVVWLQPKNNIAGTKNDLYINRFNVAKWQQTPTQIGSAPVSGNPNFAYVLTETDTFLSLWTQDDPAKTPTALPTQLYSKQILFAEEQPALAPVTVPKALPGSRVGPELNFIFAINTASDANLTGASIAAFNTNSISKTVIPIDANPATLGIDNFMVNGIIAPALDRLNQTLFRTNTLTKNLDAYSINSNTGELKLSSSATIAATNVQSRAVASHPNGFVYLLSLMTTTNDNGTLSAYQYNLQNKSLVSISTNSLVTNSIVSVQLSPVSITIHPNGKYLYVTNSGSGTISIFSINTITGELTFKENHNPAIGLPNVLTFSAIANDGKYLYVVNRVAPSIVKFDINIDGTLALNPKINTFNTGEGGLPQEIVLDSLNKYLYVISQTDNSIHAFKISQLDGSLTHINKINSINNPDLGGNNTFTAINGLAISPDGKQIYTTDFYYDNVSVDLGELYIFDVQQTDNININQVKGGLYNPGNPAPGSSVTNGHRVIASQAGRCPL